VGKGGGDISIIKEKGGAPPIQQSDGRGKKSAGDLSYLAERKETGEKGFIYWGEKSLAGVA